MTRLLLVSPAFYGLWEGIEAAFEAHGHDVTTHRYDHFATLRHKARNKLRYELPERLGRGSGPMADDLARSAVAALEAARPDVVVVIKGDAIGPAFWDALDRRRTPRVLWLYDGLSLLSYDEERLRRADAIVSFSHADVATMTEQGLPAHHLHLGFDSLLALPTLPSRDEVVFAGARYPARERLLLGLGERGVPVRAFGRQWSHHPWDRLRTWDVRRPDVPAGRDLDRATACARLRAATAAVNAHGPQDGFNLRVFEACGVGGVQLVDRDDVTELYEPGVELAVYHDVDELASLCQRAHGDRAWADGLREAGARRTAAEHTLVHRTAVVEALWA